MVSTKLWSECLKTLERELSGQDFNVWIRPLQALEDAQTLRLLAPNRFVMDYVKQHYSQRITDLLVRLRPNGTPQLALQVGNSRVSVSSPPPAQTLKVINTTATVASTATISPIVNHLNPKLLFNHFVAGKSNQIALSSAQQAATEPSLYNPLFIYGGVGLGKTHLIHAVGNQILQKQPYSRVLYVPSERFVSEMVKALHEKKMNEFKRHYRSVDTLLIDDVQFFMNKAQSQEELFHTFNYLFDNQKQIIFTCDRPPQNLQGIEERLKSRFSCGLAVAVEQPDLETRVAIIHAKARLAQTVLPEEVAYFIAYHIQSNVRELEGALHRIIATARFTNAVITLENVQETLKDLLSHAQSALITLAIIQKTVADYFRVPVSTMRSRQRTRQIARPRQIAMSLAKELTQHSLPEIGDAFGGRDHSTVLYSCRTVAKLKTADQQIQQDYSHLLKRLSH
ncbi:chromosomal replication initiator protein DnaA [Beggiatoa leptomitoformis]|uniref:Chromosomal replication initiator protein DnaA n=1 Tax=Beggiatoa leptomitoformis TaxID=288004 RepID=A0A2N9YCG0_9GAMM|nr:chromosomal replication initiator protein DnaA [Beggiatoa leptomitoformis]ALG66558.1 chromosomal replication initiator protein DnaA [Beggiatoa leptomitoformis]AUI68143.1 chromosomal replication initiator protein DnaA [Beggiatoa leptomitoformis]